MAQRFPLSITVISTGVKITTGAASASSALPTAQSGTVPSHVRVAATVAAHVRLGIGSATAVQTDMLVQPGDAVILRVPGGATHVAAIQASAAGIVIVSPVEDA